MSKVTAVLISWKRSQELEAIKKHLGQFDFIDEILVWKNTEERNIGVYGRYLMAKQAKNDIIYTQDDDCIIGNIQALYANFDGEHLSNGLKSNAMKEYASQEGNDPYITLIGWGAFYKKEWINVIDKYLEKYPEDELFYECADRIFTYLLKKRHDTIISRVDDFPSARGEMAMYRRGGYDDRKKIILEKLKTL